MATFYMTGTDNLATATAAGSGTLASPANAWSRISSSVAANDEIVYRGVFRTTGREITVNAAAVRLRPALTQPFNPLKPHAIFTGSEPTPTSGWTIVNAGNRCFSTNIGASLTLNAVTYRFYDTARFVSFTKGGTTFNTLAPATHLRRRADVTTAEGTDNSWFYNSTTGVLTVRYSALAAGGPGAYNVTMADDSTVSFPEIEYCRNVSANQLVLNGSNIVLSGGMHIDRCGPRQDQANYNIQVTAGQSVSISDVVAKDAAYHNIGCSGAGLSSQMRLTNCYGITVNSTTQAAGTPFVHFTLAGDLADVIYTDCTAFACYPLDVTGSVFADTQSLSTPVSRIVAFYSHTANGCNVVRSEYVRCTALLGWAVGSTTDSENTALGFQASDALETTMIENDPFSYPMFLDQCKEISVPYSAIGTPGSVSNNVGSFFAANCSTYIRGGVYDYTNPTPNKGNAYQGGCFGFSTSNGPALTMTIDGATILYNALSSVFPSLFGVFSAVSFRQNDVSIGANVIFNWNVSGDQDTRPLANRLRIYNCIVQDRRPDPGASGCLFIVSCRGALCDVRNNIFIRETPATSANQFTAVTLIGADYTLNSNVPASLSQGCINSENNLWVGFQSGQANWLRGGDWRNPAQDFTRNTKANFFRSDALPLGIQRDGGYRCIDVFSSADFPNMGSHNLTVQGAAAPLRPTIYTIPGSTISSQLNTVVPGPVDNRYQSVSYGTVDIAVVRAR
jgi:hypothetical protein